MASPRIRQDPQRITGRAWGRGLAGQAELAKGLVNLGKREARRGADLPRLETVEHHHVLQPEPQLGIAGWTAELGELAGELSAQPGGNLIQVGHDPRGAETWPD